MPLTATQGSIGSNSDGLGMATPVTMTARQLATLEELAQLDSQLAGIFRYGHNLVQEASNPGAVYLLAHAGRELGRGVVRLLAGSDYLLEDLEEIQEEKNRDTIAAVLQLPLKHASVTKWLNLNQIFSDSVHFRVPAPTSERVVDAFLEFTELLYGRVAPYFATHAELQQLMSIEKPSADDAERARSLLVRSTQRHYFFSNLAHPGWLEPLAESRYFAVPPDVITDRDGRMRTQPWPEGQYLVKVAGKESKRVAEVLNGISSGIRNPVVWLAVTQAASKMPGPEARRLVPGIVAALRGSLGVDLITHEGVTLVRHLAIEKDESAFKLSEALLWTAKTPVGPQNMEEVADGRSFRLGRGRGETEWMLARIDGYDLGRFCREAVPALEALNPRQTLELLSDRLDRTVFLGERESPAASTFMRRSTWWCADVNHADHTEDVRAQFAVATAGVAARMALKDSATARIAWEVLSAHRTEVFERIRLNTLADAGSHLQEELDAAIGGEALLDPNFGAREAASLLRRQFDNSSPSARRLFRYALERGPSPEEIQAALKWNREPSGWMEFSEAADGTDQSLPIDEQSDEAEIQEIITDWQRLHLRWFHDRIPDELRQMSDRLGIESKIPSLREQAHDEGRTYTEGGWVSRPKVMPSESLEELSGEQLVNFLIGWHPSQGQTDSEASNYGLREALSNYANADPGLAMLAAELALRSSVPEEFVGALLAGVEKAAEAGKAVPWQQVVATALMIASSVDAIAAVRSELEREGDSPDGEDDAGRRGRDPVSPLQNLARIAASLIEKGCNQNLIPGELADEVWAYADASVSSLLTWVSEPSDSSSRTFDEILTDSLNVLGGDVAAMVVDVGLWDYRRLAGVGGIKGQDIEVPQVAQRFGPLAAHILLQRGRGARAALARLGTWLPQVRLLAPGWLREAEEALFANGARSPEERPAWGAYITSSQFFGSVFRDLRRWYAVAAEAARDTSANNNASDDWSLTQGLAQHVLVATLHGLCQLGDADALIETTFSTVPVKERAHAYWSVFRSWSDSPEPVPAAIAARLVTFWEWRIAGLEKTPELDREEEAEGLTWFIATPFVPVADAIRLGCQTVRLIRGAKRLPTFSWERMKTIAEEAPASSFELTELLVEQALKGDYVYLPFGEAEPAFRAALGCGDARVRSRAQRLINRIGDRGLFEYQTLLSQVGESNSACVDTVPE
jgi:hypothetical protein